MKTREMSYIEIEWEGPLTLEDTKLKNGREDYGLYQVYGDHAVYGRDTLLYIGKAEQQTFSVRFAQHTWIPYEQLNPKIYLGRFGSTDTDKYYEKWVTMINQSERLLIYYCAPSYNSSGIGKYGDFNDVIILNYGSKAMLPYELSTLYEESDYGKEDKRWGFFIERVKSTKNPT